MWIWGKHAFLSVLKNPRRIINNILITKNNIKYIDKIYMNKTKIVDSSKIRYYINNDATKHQGFCIKTSPILQRQGRTAQRGVWRCPLVLCADAALARN